MNIIIVNHVGFLILALAINTKTGLESFIFYLTQYSITNLNLFLIIIAFGYLSYNYLNNNKFESFSNYYETPKNISIKKDLNFISQLTDLFKNNSLLTISFAITLFSFAGVPPLLGFYGKMQVLYTSISVGFIFVSIIAINMSVISAYYYLKLIQVSNFINTNLKSDLIKSITLIKLAPTQNIIYETQPQQSQISQLSSINNSKFINNSHSYFISIITLIILLFTFKTDLLFNFTSLLTSYSYYI
jgi:NADH-ubiquinone oxidoreductase chain 2